MKQILFFLIKLNVISLHEVKLGHLLFEPSLSYSWAMYSEGKEIGNYLFVNQLKRTSWG